MIEGPPSPYRIPFDGSFSIADAAHAPPAGADLSKATLKAELDGWVDRMADLQRILYANDHHALLLVFQALDAAGKDGTIRAILSGVNPAGCQVSSFKQPSAEELDHDFLWRTARRLPERGRIGVFNRSYYEEVLVVRVHPEYLGRQRLPSVPTDLDQLWEQRFESIRDHELHLARNGTVVLKFWLNVSQKEQHQRFLDRLEEPEKHWKFSHGDLKESARWADYMTAYEAALNGTSRPWAPWYAIPADDKRYMRCRVAEIVVKTLEGMGLQYPAVEAEDEAHFDDFRTQLRASIDQA